MEYPQNPLETTLRDEWILHLRSEPMERVGVSTGF